MAAVQTPNALSTRSRRRRLPISNFWAKLVMAVTGLIFVAFVFVHMYGNLHIFYGPESFDEYAHWLRTVFEPLLPYEGLLWILRVVLLASLVAHVGCAILLWVRARRARGPFSREGLPLKTLQARTMLVSGIVILLFVIFHILDLTIGAAPAATDVFEYGAAYANLVASFQRPVVALFYILAMVLLAAHIAHGVWTTAHDLGVTGRRWRAGFLIGGGVLAIAIAAGNILIPVLVMTGAMG